MNLQNETDTEFVLTGLLDGFTLNLNVNDLAKIDVDYILAVRDLTYLETENIRFEIAGTGNGYTIYHVLYSE